MEITVTGRHIEVPARLARHVEDKLAKVPQLDPRVMRCDVVITHEPNPRRAKEAYRVEVTCRSKRSVVRAEASADEEYAALDLVMGKLGERLRRQHDRRRIQRGQHRTMSVAEATADLPVLWRPFVAAAGFALAVSLGEFGATAFLAQPDSPTLPVVIYQLIGRPGDANFGGAMAASVVLAAVTGLVMVAVDKIGGVAAGRMG